jgi:Holliday junction resolvase
VKELDFEPAKGREDFRRNYKLHDRAEEAGKNLLTQWGIQFKTFGEDKRYQKVWEKGEDKPDLIISFAGKSAFLDWKGKHKNRWLVNRRAIEAYERWSQKFGIPVIIAFFVFNSNNDLMERRFALVNSANYKVNENRAWDKNHTVEFTGELQKFDRNNILQVLLDKTIGK